VRLFASCVTAIVAVTACVAASDTRSLSLPDSLAQYRTWWEPAEKPVPVPTEVWTLCIAPSTKTHGPHVDRFVRVYINPAGREAFQGGPSSVFPVGTIIAKEKLTTRDAKVADGIGFMVKRLDAQFPSSGGWQFLYYPQVGTPGDVQDHCARCHHSAEQRDYVFTRHRSEPR
jgi:hypothetical protein